MAEVILQIGIVRAFRQYSAEILDCSLQLASFDLCNSQGVVRTGTLEIRNGLGGITLRQKRITQELMSDSKVRTELKCVLEGKLPELSEPARLSKSL